jgi:hypothetical protein
VGEEADAGGEGEEDDECDCGCVLEQFVGDSKGIVAYLRRGSVSALWLSVYASGIVGRSEVLA